MDTIYAILAFPNQYIGLITLVAGLTAIYLYARQKNDYKRSAASLIVQEVRSAEQKIKAHQAANQSRLYVKILPTNHWYENIHLFISDLDETEIELISKFYSQAEFLDRMIKKIEDSKASLPSITPVQVQLPTPSGSGQAVQQQSIGISVPSASETFLNQVAGEVESLYNTPAINKLRIISEKKWYFLI